MKNSSAAGGMGRKWIIPLVFLAYSACAAQNVIRILNGYVLFDSADPKGKIGDEVVLYRKTGPENTATGRVKLLLFKDGKASGRIVSESKSHRIQVGDCVFHPENSMAVRNAPDSAQTATAGQRPVIRVVSEYALVDPGSERWERDAILQVRRLTDQGLIDIGEMRILRFENGKAGVKILHEVSSFRVMPGDFASLKTSNYDIDTYFLESFRSD
jgi:hypothetical protein